MSHSPPSLPAPPGETTLNEGRCYFRLAGEFDPAALTTRLGVEPTEAWRRGERNPGRDLPRCSLWKFGVADVRAEVVDIEAMSLAVVTPLEPSAAAIAEAARDWDLHVSLVVALYFSPDERLSTPIVVFPPRVIAFLAQVGGCIDVDTYLL